VLIRSGGISSDNPKPTSQTLESTLRFVFTKAGYYSWRNLLKKRQAEQVSQMCRDYGYAGETAEWMAPLIRKEDMKADEESQILDVVCLVFLDD
jgi:hypothetical protein